MLEKSKTVKVFRQNKIDYDCGLRKLKYSCLFSLYFIKAVSYSSGF